MRFSSGVATVMMVLGLVAATATAAPGDLDTTFGTSGVRTVTNGTSTTYHDVVRAAGSNGRYFASGVTLSGGKVVPILTAFTEAGAVETSFGTNGHFIDTTLPDDARLTSVTYGVYVPPMSQITLSYVYVVVTLPSDIVVYRYLVDNNGTWADALSWKSTVHFDGGAVADLAAIWAPFNSFSTSSYIVVAGAGKDTVGGLQQGVFLKIGHTTGALLTSWGTNGRKYVSAGTTATQFRALSVTGSDYCAIGRAKSGSNPLDAAVVCVTASTGALDTNFDGDGIKTWDWGDATYTQVSGRSVYYDFGSPGKLTVAANMCNSATGVCHIGLARMSMTGAFDTTFSGDGLAHIDLGGGGTNIANPRILVYGGSRFMLAGQKWDSTQTTMDRFLFSFTNSGAADSTFGSGGQRTFSAVSTGLEGYGGMIYNYGSTKLVVVGDRDSGSNVLGLIARHNMN